MLQTFHANRSFAMSTGKAFPGGCFYVLRASGDRAITVSGYGYELGNGGALAYGYYTVDIPAGGSSYPFLFNDVSQLGVKNPQLLPVALPLHVLTPAITSDINNFGSLFLRASISAVSDNALCYDDECKLNVKVIKCVAPPQGMKTNPFGASFANLKCAKGTESIFFGSITDELEVPSNRTVLHSLCNTEVPSHLWYLFSLTSGIRQALITVSTSKVAEESPLDVSI